MSNVDWDADHCYCSCEVCSPTDWDGKDTDDGPECSQELYCVPHGGCGCTDHMVGEELADHIEGFIGLVEEQNNPTFYEGFYELPKLRDEVKQLRLIQFKNILTKETK